MSESNSYDLLRCADVTDGGHNLYRRLRGAVSELDSYDLLRCADAIDKGRSILTWGRDIGMAVYRDKDIPKEDRMRKDEHKGDGRNIYDFKLQISNLLVSCGKTTVRIR